MTFGQLLSEELLDEESMYFGCGRDIPDRMRRRRRLVGLQVASTPQCGDNPMGLDGGTSDFHRELDDDRDVDMSGMDYASNMDHSAVRPQHDGSMDPCHDDPSSLPVEAHRKHNVDNRMDASEGSQE